MRNQHAIDYLNLCRETAVGRCVLSAAEYKRLVQAVQSDDKAERQAAFDRINKVIKPGVLARVGLA